LQEICDRLQPGTIEVFAQRWLHHLPLPFGPADQRAGYWWEISMRQVEVSRTLVFDAPRRARAFFEALIADNLDVGRPANVEIIFGRRIRRDTPGVFRTAIDRPAVGPDTGGVVPLCPPPRRDQGRGLLHQAPQPAAAPTAGRRPAPGPTRTPRRPARHRPARRHLHRPCPAQPGRVKT